MSESGERRTFLAVLLAAFILSATWATFSRSSFARRGLTFMSSSAMVCGLWKGKGSGRQQQVTWGGLSHVRTRSGNSSSAGGGRAVPRATDGRLQPEPAATLHLLLKGAAVYPDRPSQACVEPRAALSTSSFTPPLMPPHASEHHLLDTSSCMQRRTSTSTLNCTAYPDLQVPI